MKIWRQEDWTEMSGGMSGTDAAAGEAGRELKSANIGAEGVLADAKAAREKAVYYLQFSSKTESELRKKLAEHEFSPASVDYAIQFVKEYRYLDDEDYTRRYIERNGTRKSRKQMRYGLSQKGVAREMIDLVLEDTAVDEETQILSILRKKNYSGAEAEWEETRKITAYLARKGFSYDVILSAMNRFS